MTTTRTVFNRTDEILATTKDEGALDVATWTLNPLDAVTLAATLVEVAEEALVNAVLHARSTSNDAYGTRTSWTAIGTALGVSKQAAAQRFGPAEKLLAARVSNDGTWSHFANMVWVQEVTEVLLASARHAHDQDLSEQRTSEQATDAPASTSVAQTPAEPQETATPQVNEAPATDEHGMTYEATTVDVAARETVISAKCRNRHHKRCTGRWLTDNSGREHHDVPVTGNASACECPCHEA